MTFRLGKLVLIPVLLVAACALAGVYGALHDQISYTISPDYFSALKFHLFEIPPGLQDRRGAAIVGFQATWWLGALIGAPLAMAAMVIPGAWPYAKHTLAAFAVALATALGVGLVGLMLAAMTISNADLPYYAFPEGVADQVSFVRVAVMHDFSYLGGFLGLGAGLIYLALVGWRMRERSPESRGKAKRQRRTRRDAKRRSKL
jgi:MFS family permease